MLRPYLKTSEVVIGVTPLESLQSGQWLKIGNRRARFVRQRGTGETFVFSGVRRLPVNLAGFRLSCGVPTDKVLTRLLAKDNKTASI